MKRLHEVEKSKTKNTYTYVILNYTKYIQINNSVVEK